MPALKGLATGSVAADEEFDFGSAKSRERDETQKNLDAEIGGLVAEWNKAAESKKVKRDTIAEAARPRKRFYVDPEHKSELKRMLRRSGVLHKVEIVFMYPKGKTTELVNDKGLSVITLTAGPVKPKTH